MRFCHLFVFALLQFTTGLLQRNENYVLRMGLDDLSCIEHGRLFVHDNMSLFQCMALCSNVSSCWYLSYIRNIGRCVGFDSKATLAFVNGSRVYMKVSSDLGSDGSSECVSLTVSYGESGRCSKKLLNVNNGGTHGFWHGPQFCSSGSYAAGYSLKIESNQLPGNRVVRGLALRCYTMDNIHTMDLIVPFDPEAWKWKGPEMCPNKGDVLKAFQMQVETNDDNLFTDASDVYFVRFLCGPLNSSLEISEANTLGLLPGKGPTGTFGNWSEYCDVGQGVCGLKVKMERMFETLDIDWSGLNDVILYCC